MASIIGAHAVSNANPLPLEWTILTTSPAGGSGVAAGGGKLVVLQSSLSSGQIISWPEDAPGNRSTFDWPARLTPIVFGEGVFVVAAGNALLSSSNAVNWVAQPFAGDLGHQVVYGNGVFLARSSKNLLRSTDGFTWAEVTPPSTNGNRGIQFIGVPETEGVFHFRDQETVYLSADGLTWTEGPEDTPLISKLAYGNGRFVGIGANYDLFTSTDGTNWSAPQDLGIVRSSIAFGNGYFVVVGPNARAYSRHGTTWTVVPNALTSYNVTFANGIFYSGTFSGLYRSEVITTLSIDKGGKIVVSGVAGAAYQLESTDRLGAGWLPQQTFTMPASAPYLWSDPRPRTGNARFYRTIGP